MPITTQTVDSSGEILHLQGLDISDFLDGYEGNRAWANWEHNNNSAEDLVGKFRFAKKIFGPDDCETPRQKMYWDKLQTPFLYGVCELMDQEGHPGSVAIAAMIRYFKNRSEPVMVGASIEGQTLERKDGDLLRTVGRRVAITLRPCNRQCWVDFLGEGEQADKFVKSMFEGSSSQHLVEIDSAIMEDVFKDDAVGHLKKALEDLNKTLTAGNYGVAPEALSGGAALAVEDRGLKNRLKALYRDWNRTRPLREVIKAAMPEVSEQYVDHFVDLTHDLALKKGMQPEKLTRVSSQHSLSGADNDDQKKLIEGLYWNMAEPYKPSHNQHNSMIKALQNDSGNQVLVKLDRSNMAEDVHHRATAYYRLAKDFYGMGDHVPVTAHFRHGSIYGGTPMQAIEYVKGARTPLESSKLYADSARKAREDGTMHKLAMMDMINGMIDRHLGNVMVHPSGHLVHVDNDMGVTEMGTEPSYLDQTKHFEGIGADQAHVDASRWLNSLDWRNMAQHAKQHGVDMGTIKAMASRLAMLQAGVRKGLNFRQMADAMKHAGYMA